MIKIKYLLASFSIMTSSHAFFSNEKVEQIATIPMGIDSLFASCVEPLNLAPCLALAVKTCLPLKIISLAVGGVAIVLRFSIVDYGFYYQSSGYIATFYHHAPLTITNTVLSLGLFISVALVMFMPSLRAVRALIKFIVFLAGSLLLTGAIICANAFSTITFQRIQLLPFQFLGLANIITALVIGVIGIELRKASLAIDIVAIVLIIEIILVSLAFFYFLRRFTLGWACTKSTTGEWEIRNIEATPLMDAQP